MSAAAATHETPVSATPAVETSTTAPVTSTETAAPISTTTEPAIDATPAATSTEPTTTTAATETATDAPVASAETAKDGDLVKVEASPISSGNLGIKVGPLKLFKYSQRYVWLGDEAALDEETIAHFHKGDHENKHHTAAHASQTGAGLLLYAKRAEDKTHPDGIFNLSEVTDVIKQGTVEFTFKEHGKKQSFQATSAAERDGWLVAINNAVTQASGSKDTLRESEGYKNSHKKYLGAGGLAAPGAVGAAAATDLNKTEDKTAVPAKERSSSRGLFGRNKSVPKEDKSVKEKAVEKKEETKVALEEKKEEKKIEKAEKKEEKAEAKEAKKEETATPAAAAVTTSESKPSGLSKRLSIFGKKPTKTSEPIAAEAPKVDAPVESGAPLTETVPTGPSTTTAATETPAVTEAAPATTATETAPKEALRKERSPSPKSKVFGLFGKKGAKTDETTKSEASPVTGTGPASTPFAESAVPEGAKKVEETPLATETPAVTSTETPAATDSLTTPTAETTGTTKSQDKRRSSFQALTSVFRSGSKKAEKPSTSTADVPPVPSKDAETAAAPSSTDAAIEAVPVDKARSGSIVADVPQATVVTAPHGSTVPAFGQPTSV